MIVVLILIGLLIVFAIGIWLTSTLVGLIVTLFVAGIIGWIADSIVPGRLPYGWLGAIVAGVLGSWLGSLVLGGFGPDIAGIAIIPALLGAIVLAFVASGVTKVSGARKPS
ncbi:MAG TPA: GlsB/YeaQ/YmgE family stress response membrane protein [Nitrolancea sp.]|nr:GlsB/YeaQ/YmgE family stress response membrane protein [Nitrolancea sp.]